MHILPEERYLNTVFLKEYLYHTNQVTFYIQADIKMRNPEFQTQVN